MGLLNQTKDTISRNKSRSKSDASSIGAAASSSGGTVVEGGGTSGGGVESSNDTTKLDEDQGNVLMSIIQQRGCRLVCFAHSRRITGVAVTMDIWQSRYMDMVLM
jgi:hypothetical protein